MDCDCELKKYIRATLNVDFNGDYIYYEFTNLEEDIHEDREVLLQDKKETEAWFRLAPCKDVEAGGLKLYGKGIARSNFERYRVFIQSQSVHESGARPLPRDSYILYNHCDDKVQLLLLLYYHHYHSC